MINFHEVNYEDLIRDLEGQYSKHVGVMKPEALIVLVLEKGKNPKIGGSKVLDQWDRAEEVLEVLQELKPELYYKIMIYNTLFFEKIVKSVVSTPYRAKDIFKLLIGMS